MIVQQQPLPGPVVDNSHKPQKVARRATWQPARELLWLARGAHYLLVTTVAAALCGVLCWPVLGSGCPRAPQHHLQVVTADPGEPGGWWLKGGTSSQRPVWWP